MSAIRRWRFLALGLLAMAGIAAAMPAAADGVGERRLEDAAHDAKALLAGHALAERVSFRAVRTEDGAVLVDHRSEVPMHPASNMKVLTAFAALHVLGPAHRFRTRVYGDVDAVGAVKTLYLVGDGDPSLTGADLSSLARRLRDDGLTRVGQLVVDASAFDDELLAAGFESQPKEDAPFRAAIAGIAIDRASFAITVAPAPSAGGPARITHDAPGYVVLENAVTTAAAGSPPAVSLTPDGDRLRVRVTGAVAPASGRVVLRRRVLDPRWHAAWRFAEALSRVGIVLGEPRPVLGRADGSAALLAEQLSEPLARVLDALGKESDNFSAEMLLKSLARVTGSPGNGKGGIVTLTTALRAAGVALPSTMRISNGSGLFGETRVTTTLLTDVLARGASDAGVAPEYVAHFAVGGRDGTLKNRFLKLPRGAVRAKTGTLANVVALSGYILDERGQPSLAFAFLANNVGGDGGRAKALADELVSALAAGRMTAGPPNGAR